MTLSVVIPTYRKAESIFGLIKCLADQDFEKRNLQVLLVSNLKDEQLEKRAREWSKWFYDFKFLVTGEKGVNKARNMGVRFASGDIIYFLDDDCLLSRQDHLKQIVTLHEKYKDAAGIGGGYRLKDEESDVSRFYYSQAMEWIEKSLTDQQNISQLFGGNASYKREIFDKGFLFDSTIVFGGSEESFNQALCDNGYSLMIFRSLDVLHMTQLNLFALSKKGFYQGAGYFKNRYKQGQPFDFLIDMEREGAVYTDRKGVSALLYHSSFKMGYFWEASKNFNGFFLFRWIYFLLLILKSRWTVWRPLSWVWWLSGKYVWRPLGWVWWLMGMYVLRPLGWILGRSVLRPLGWVWWLTGMYIWRPLSWFLGVSIWRPFGWLWWSLGMYVLRPLGWTLGVIVLRPLGWLWWLLGRYVWRPLVWLSWSFKVYTRRFLGWVWWLTGMYIWRPLSWLLGVSVLRFLGWLWWLLGKYMWRPLVWLSWTFKVSVRRFLGWVWWLTGMYIWRPLIWLLGVSVLRPLGWIWWLLGAYAWRPLVWLGWTVRVFFERFLGVLWWLWGMCVWRPVGWLLGVIVLRPLGWIWWLLGVYIWRPFVWLSWSFKVYGQRSLGWFWWLLGIYVWRPLGWFWWLLGMYVWRPLGWFWWLLGMYVWRPLNWLWYRSPFMKIYYFSRYQFYTRLKPFFKSSRDGDDSSEYFR